MSLDTGSDLADLEARMRSVVNLVDRLVPRQQWTNDEIDAKFGRRSAVEIVTDGNTFYMNPCLDLTVIAVELMKRGKMNPYLVIEEQKIHGQNFPKLHFAIEFEYKGREYFIDFCTTNKVVLGEGKYSNTRGGVDTMKITRVSADVLSSEVPAYISLGLEGALSMLTPVIEKFKKDNTPQNYEGYVQQTGGKGFYIAHAGDGIN